MDVTCPSCAAENYDSARYCRKCGAQLGSAEFHEAPTRGLDHQRPPEPPPARAFETFGSAQLPSDGPRYAPPTVTPTGAGLQPVNMTGMPMRVETGPMSTGPVSKGPNWFLIIGAIVLAAFIGGVSMLALVANHLKNRISDRPPASEGDRAKGSDSNPPPNAPPAGTPKTGSIDTWRYEGAKVKVSSPNLLVMETDDDIADIAEFYRSKFDELGIEPMNVNPDEDDEDVAFIAGGLVVAISPSDGDPDGGGKSEVVVTMGGEFPGFPGIPGVPGMPPPPAPPAPPATAPSKTGDAPTQTPAPAEAPKTLKQPK